MNKRIILSLGGTLKDLSSSIRRYDPATSALCELKIATQDKIFIGSRLPFNHFYAKLAVLNATPAVMKVRYFSTAWNDVAELIDETNGFQASGFVTFVPNRNAAWCMMTESKQVAGLESTLIYDLYWLEVSFDVDLDVGTALNWIGELFSDDLDLGSEFPDLLKAAVKTAYKTGKTDWEEQHARAAEIIIEDLVSKAVINDGSQILIRTDYKNAAICKVAEIIYNAFGDDYTDQKKSARMEYDKRIDKRIHRVDQNSNGAEEVEERKSSTGWLSR